MEGINRPFAATEKPNTLHSEHLREDIKPIMVCLMSEDFDTVTELGDDDESTEEIDHSFIASLGTDSEDGIRNSTSWIGVTSEVNTSSKYSAEHRNCVGFAVIGQNKTTNENISFMVHIDPQHFHGNFESFQSIVSKKLTELVTASTERSIDAVIYGGRTEYNETDVSFDAETKDYNRAIDIISNLINKKLGFEPVIFKPKPLQHSSMGTTVYLDTTRRRLYLAQKDVQNDKPQTFIASEKETSVPKYSSPLVDIKLPKMDPWTD